MNLLGLMIALLVAVSVRAAVSIPANDPHFVYEGRFDLSDPTSPAVIWQASRIRLGFTGESLTLLLSQLNGQVFFDATVDGKTTLIALPEQASQDRFTLNGLGAGEHQLVLFKRSEANAGWVRFRGVELADGAKPIGATVPAYTHRIGFIGDSITVGACNEDGASDQWEDRRTHNAALSYAALTAAALNASHRNIAVSGMGIVLGWVPQLAGDTWNRVYPNPESPIAPHTAWEPEVVFINLGENDSSRSAALHQPFPSAKFTLGYVALARAVRSRFPKTEIVALRGGMGGGANNPELRAAWEAAVQELERADAHVHHFVFKHWSEPHPRVADDRAMADELVAWLKQQPFLK